MLSRTEKFMNLGGRLCRGKELIHTTAIGVYYSKTFIFGSPTLPSNEIAEMRALSNSDRNQITERPTFALGCNTFGFHRRLR